MKSTVYNVYGGPEVVSIQEQVRPEPQVGEILVKVHASTVTATDSIFRKGQTWSARLFTGVRRPSRPTLGSEFVGEVVDLGANVQRFALGDMVLGPTAEGFGAHAEYIVLPEDSVLVQKPGPLSLQEAAALSSGALTALPFLREVAQIRPGQKILIIGASGSVGSFAVQIAAYLGAHVTGVSSAANVDWVRELGADEVIDYTQEDFTTRTNTFDIVFDTVGKSSFAQASKALKTGGQYLSTVLSLGILWQSFWSQKLGKYTARFAATGMRSPEQQQQDLDWIAARAAAGELRAVIDRIYPLEHIQQAHAYVDQGHKKGNLVLTISDEAKAAAAEVDIQLQSEV